MPQPLDQEFSENVRCWWQTVDSAALPPCLLLGKKEKGQGSSRHQLPRSQPAGTFMLPALLPHQHHSKSPRHTIPTQTLSHYISLLLWKPIWRKQGTVFPNMVGTSSSPHASDPASSVRVRHFSTRRTHTCATSRLSLWENHLIPLPVRYTAAPIHQQRFRKTWKQPWQATLSLH